MELPVSKESGSAGSTSVARWGITLGQNEETYDEIQEELESEAIENYDNGSEVYINGKKNNDIDINGINLDKYNIKIKEGKIYLIDKYIYWR